MAVAVLLGEPVDGQTDVARHIYVEALDGYWAARSDIIRTGGKPTFGEMKFEPVTDERLPIERFQKFLA